MSAGKALAVPMPLLPLASNAQPKARGVNTGPFGETIGGDKRPVKQVSAS